MTDDAQRGKGAGHVILVGAGPGDPGLMTVRGAAALASADVVLYDELASDELLHLVAERAECINVGKRGHAFPTRTQEEINALIVERALAGQRVVRLKGGDPFVFGRGGEEASECVKAGVTWEVVPGVSSTVGALAYAGIPVTDRRYSASFAVVTGHKDPTRVSEETRWKELGSAVDTLVIVMGMRNLAKLVGHIIDGGRDPETPAAAVMNGTLGRQRTVEAPLSKLPERVASAKLGAPSVVVIGDVVRLREQLAWWELTPLFGRRVLVTRTPDQSGEMMSALREAGAEPVLRPMVRLVAPESTPELDEALGRLGDYDGLIFTSANAVRFFAQRACELGADSEFAGLSARIFCVGPQSARAALEAGLGVHLSGGGSGDSEAFLEQLLEAYPASGRRFLLPRSNLAREVIPEGLRAAGATVDAVEAYRNEPGELDGHALEAELLSGAYDVVTFASPSAARNFLSLLGEEGRNAVSDMIVAAVGKTTSRALEEEGLTPQVVPARPGGLELVAALVDYCSKQGD